MIRSLRTELTALFLLIALVPLVAALGIGWWQARRILEHELSQSLRAIATRQSSMVNDAVRDVELQTERLASSPMVRSVPAAGAVGGDVADLLAGAMTNGGFENLLLIDREGRLLYSVREAGTRGALLSESFPNTELTRVVDRARTILETELSDMELGADGSPHAYAATPIFAEGRLLGVLALQVGAQRLLRGVDNYTGLGTTGETIVATLRGGDALLVAPTRGNPEAAFKQVVSGAKAGGTPILQSVRGQRGAGLGTDQNMREVFAVWRYIPAMRWGIVVKIDRDEAFAAVDQLGLVTATLLGVTVLLVPFVAFFQANRLTRPILQLRDLTGEVARGNFDARASIQARHEIADLAASFAGMTQQLRTSFEDLRRTTAEREQAAREAIAAKDELARINANLESIVADRTRELSERNAQLEQLLGDLRRTQQQLIVSEKMASLGELTAGVAHEISNPLNFVNNFADLSVEGVADLRASLEAETDRLSENARADVEDLLPVLSDNMTKIRDHGRRAQRIVQGMLELTRGTSGERRPADLNRFVQDFTRATLQAARGKEGATEVGVEFVLAPDLPEVPIFPAELSRALMNVLSNAIWAVGERAKSGPPNYAPHILVSTRREPEHLVVAIRDNGPGIPEGNLKKIFQPFFTTRPTGMGSTGLGLSMAWEVVVTQHRGRLEVESVAQEFTEFRIVLPLR